MTTILCILITITLVWIIDKSAEGSVISKNKFDLNKINGFSPAVSYSCGFTRSKIAVDPSSSRFAVLNNDRLILFGFEQVVSVEILKNGYSLIRTDRNSQFSGAVIGAALLGPVGFLLGGMTGKKVTTEKISKLSLKIYTNDLHNPFIEVVFFDKKPGFNPRSPKIDRASQDLDAWYGRFQAILKSNRDIELRRTVVVPPRTTT